MSYINGTHPTIRTWVPIFHRNAPFWVLSRRFRRCKLHFGSLSCVDVTESSGSDSTFNEAETQRDFTKPLPEMIMALIMIVAMMRVSATRSTII